MTTPRWILAAIILAPLTMLMGCSYHDHHDQHSHSRYREPLYFDDCGPPVRHYDRHDHHGHHDRGWSHRGRDRHHDHH